MLFHQHTVFFDDPPLFGAPPRNRKLKWEKAFEQPQQYHSIHALQLVYLFQAEYDVLKVLGKI